MLHLIFINIHFFVGPPPHNLHNLFPEPKPHSPDTPLSWVQLVHGRWPVREGSGTGCPGVRRVVDCGWTLRSPSGPLLRNLRTIMISESQTGVLIVGVSLKVITSPFDPICMCGSIAHQWTDWATPGLSWPCGKVSGLCTGWWAECSAAARTAPNDPAGYCQHLKWEADTE